MSKIIQTPDMKYPIKVDLIPIGTEGTPRRRKGQLIYENHDKRQILKHFKRGILHDMGNPNATAESLSVYWARTFDDDYAGAQIVVDDKEIIMLIPALQKPEMAHHVRYDASMDSKMFGNYASEVAVGVECCYFPKDRERTQKAYDKYIWVCAYLSKFHNFPPNKWRGHNEVQPEDKVDPMSMLNILGYSLDKLKQDIEKEYNDMGKTNAPEWYETNRKLLESKNILDGSYHDPEDIDVPWKIHVALMGKTCKYYDREIEKLYKEIEKLKTTIETK